MFDYKDLNGMKVTTKEINDDLELAYFLYDIRDEDSKINTLSELQKLRSKYSMFCSGKCRKVYDELDSITHVYLGIRDKREHRIQYGNI